MNLAEYASSIADDIERLGLYDGNGVLWGVGNTDQPCCLIANPTNLAMHTEEYRALDEGEIPSGDWYKLGAQLATALGLKSRAWLPELSDSLSKDELVNRLRSIGQSDQ